MVSIISLVYDRRSLTLISSEVVRQYDIKAEDFYSKLVDAFYNSIKCNYHQPEIGR